MFHHQSQHGDYRSQSPCRCPRQLRQADRVVTSEHRGEPSVDPRQASMTGLRETGDERANLRPMRLQGSRKRQDEVTVIAAAQHLPRSQRARVASAWRGGPNPSSFPSSSPETRAGTVRSLHESSSQTRLLFREWKVVSRVHGDPPAACIIHSPCPRAQSPYSAISAEDCRPCWMKSSASLRTSEIGLLCLPLRAHSQTTSARHLSALSAASAARSRSMLRLILVFQNAARVFGHLKIEHP